MPPPHSLRCQHVAVVVAHIAQPTCENHHDQITFFGRRITHLDPTRHFFGFYYQMFR